MAAERQPSKSDKRRERQPISVPFIWEEKPGKPKKDWKPAVQPLKHAVPPLKLVVSVPFGWEEKPGTPLRSFVQPPKESKLSPSYENSIVVYSPPPKYSDHDSVNWSPSYNEGDGLSDSEIDSHSIETEDSFSSAKSLMANALVSTNALSNAVPVYETSLALTTTTTYGGQAEEGPYSSDSETESNASGSTSLVGASFLEWLFPLLVPKDSSRGADVQEREFLHERNCSLVRRPLLTLGELIVMSRRRSCQRKVISMPKQPSMDFLKGNAFACGILGSGNGLRGLHTKWKRQLQLKLM
ncbi:hypothetical protein ABFS83_06G042200 [Erythranthe nasuta]